MKHTSFRQRYSFALLLLAIFALVLYANTIFLIKEQAKYAEIINHSGKERMLTVKMAHYADRLFHHQKEKDRTLLQTAIAEFEETEHTLEEKGYGFEQEEKKRFLTQIKRFLDDAPSMSLEKLEKECETLVTKIDGFVFIYQNESLKTANNIENIETVMLVLFLLLLLVEAFFIFLPAEKEIKAKTRELVEMNKGLEQRIAEEVKKNQEKNSHMFQQSRMAQMGEMISMIAHQWRQPLSAISAITSTLTIDATMNAYDKEFFIKKLGSIEDISMHLSSTIDDFREFFKTVKEKETSTWTKIVEACLNIIGPTLTTKNITIHTAFETEDEVFTHTNEVKQAILNIIKNAEDILLEKKIPDAQIWIQSYCKNGNISLCIEDNAGGIPETIIDKIFDPYFSTKKQNEGTGLGLYMSKTIIEEHCGGTLHVKNSENGALFEISLPCHRCGDVS